MPPVVYLGIDEADNSQVYRIEIGDEAKQISEAEAGVFDFAVAPDGRIISYSTIPVDGTSSIWLTDIDGRNPRLLLTCSQAECSRPVWANDSRRLIYEKRLIEANGTVESPYIWWLDVETGETRPVLEDSQARGSGISFSPDGKWLSYVSPEEEGIYIYNLDDGRTQYVPGEIGVPAAWSPTSQRIVVPNLDLLIIHGDEGDDHLQHTHEYESATHLFSMDLSDDEAIDVSGDLNVEDSAADWSPDGEWIAFGRRYPGTSAGRQLWLMKADGSEQRALADDAAISYGPPFWSPDGRFLLFQQMAVDDNDGFPGIWLLDLETGQTEEIAADGMQPAWLIGINDSYKGMSN